jgi:transcriptional regulator with XRE-family HTH domain
LKSNHAPVDREKMLKAPRRGSTATLPAQLAAAVALRRAIDPLALDGAELRFMRRATGATAKDFAKDLGVSPVTLSRWENNAMVMGVSSEKLVRMAILLTLKDRVPGLVCNPQDVIKLKLVHRRDRQCTHMQSADGNLNLSQSVGQYANVSDDLSKSLCLDSDDVR